MPFAGPLGATNLVSVYFDVATVAGNASFLGGFYTDRATNFLGSVAGGNFVFYVLGDGAGTATFHDGQGYYELDAWGQLNIYDYRGVTVGTRQVASADFQSGTVTDGWITEFVVVPEPSTHVLFGIGLCVALGRGVRSTWRRTRRMGNPLAAMQRRTLAD